MSQKNLDLIRSIDETGKIPRAGWVVLIFLFFSFVINFADKALIGLASVQMMAELNLNSAQWGIVGSAFFWLFPVTGIVGGVLADRIGTKKVLAWMSATWVFVQVATLFVMNLPYLIATRIILGAGEGPAYTVSMTSGAKWLPKKKLGMGFTIINLGGNVGLALLMPFLVYLIATFGWRYGFIATAIMGVVWIVLWLWLTKEGPDRIVEPQAEATQEAKKSTWADVLPIIRSRNFIMLALVGFSSYWIFSVLVVWLPNYLENIRDMSGSYVAYLWAAQAVAQIIFALSSDFIFQKTGSVYKSRVLTLGSIAITCGLLFYFAPLAGSNMMSLVLFSFGVGMGATFFVLMPAILDSFIPAQHRGRLLGTLMFFVTLAGVIGPLVTGFIIESSAGLEAGFLNSFHFLSLLLVVFGSLFLIFSRPDQGVAASGRSKKEEKQMESPELVLTKYEYK